MNYSKTVSVLITCRNEDQNILKIISCLKGKILIRTNKLIL